MSRRWGEKIDEDFQIPGSGNRKRRAFAKEDQIEIVGEDRKTPEPDVQMKSNQTSSASASQEVIDGVDAEGPITSAPQSQSVIPRILPPVALFALGVVIGIWFGNVSEMEGKAYEGLCGPFRSLQEAEAKLLQPSKESAESEAVGKLARELELICNRPNQQAAME